MGKCTELIQYPNFVFFEHPYLPVSMGVMGLRRATQHCSASYLSSLGFSSQTISEARKHQETRYELGGIVAHLNQHTQDTYTEEEAQVSHQKVLSHSIDLQTQGSLMGMAHSDRDMARLHAVSQSGSGDWLNVMPSVSLGLHMKRLFAPNIVLAIR